MAESNSWLGFMILIPFWDLNLFVDNRCLAAKTMAFYSSISLNERTAINQKLRRNQPTQLESDKGLPKFWLRIMWTAENRSYNLALEGTVLRTGKCTGTAGRKRWTVHGPEES